MRTELVIRGTQLSQTCSVCERKGIRFLSRKGKWESGEGCGREGAIRVTTEEPHKERLGGGRGLSLH